MAQASRGWRGRQRRERVPAAGPAAATVPRGPPAAVLPVAAQEARRPPVGWKPLPGLPGRFPAAGWTGCPWPRRALPRGSCARASRRIRRRRWSGLTREKSSLALRAPAGRGRGRREWIRGGAARRRRWNGAGFSGKLALARHGAQLAGRSAVQTPGPAVTIPDQAGMLGVAPTRGLITGIFRSAGRVGPCPRRRSGWPAPGRP